MVVNLFIIIYFQLNRNAANAAFFFGYLELCIIKKLQDNNNNMYYNVCFGVSFLDKLQNSIQYVKGVGPKRAKKLKKINITTIEDMLYYYPRAYEDRSNFSKIKDCIDGQKISLEVYVYGSATVSRPRKNLSIIKVPVRDDTGFAYLIWFNRPYICNSLKKGQKIRVYGKVKITFNQIQITNAIIENTKINNKKVGRIVPIYSLTEKLTNNEIIKIIQNIILEYLTDIKEILPKDILKKYKLLDIHKSLENIHFPKDKKLYIAAKRRLVFEELLILQMGLMCIKNRYSYHCKGIEFNKISEVDDLITDLPFRLTNAQIRVFREISKDMESPKVMNRLVQGDVGSGKTIIAILSILKAVKSGYQSVMMAPTEILAVQHYEKIKNMLCKYNIKCELLVGSLSNKKKEDILVKANNGYIDVLVGTHALIQNVVQFKSLGLAITDEQHRFGVRQRTALSKKGCNPDVLVMTATPIPRTLALILYGDLDISVIDELPLGRKKIKTYAVSTNMRDRVYEFVKKQVSQKRQIYIICPLIEESENLNINSATQLYNSLTKSYFSDFQVGLLHGKMKAKEKEKIMMKFKNGELDILISTTVVEVGVDVQNANTIIIENAERFGLAQLHQLRGRVGRGIHQSYCILINESRNKVSKQRMEIMEQSTNGFEISEKDLQLRGPGEFFGIKQHGLPELRIANIFNDLNTLEIVRKVSKSILEEDPMLKKPKYREIRQKILLMFKNNVKDISL